MPSPRSPLPRPVLNEELIALVEQLIAERGSNADLNDIDVSQVESFKGLFCGHPRNAFNGDISRWDVANAKTMARMFDGSAFNGDISKWNVSGVLDTIAMFLNSQFHGDLSGWDVSQVRAMDHMFAHSKFEGDIALWDVRNAQTMVGMFAGSRFNGDLSQWNVGKCQDFTHAFQACVFRQDISAWPIANNASLSAMIADEDLAHFAVPNHYHWYRLCDERGLSQIRMPQAWKDHAQSTLALGKSLSMGRHETIGWMARTWQQKVMPESLPLPNSMGDAQMGG